MPKFQNTAIQIHCEKCGFRFSYMSTWSSDDVDAAAAAFLEGLTIGRLMAGHQCRQTTYTVRPGRTNRHPKTLTHKNEP